MSFYAKIYETVSQKKRYKAKKRKRGEDIEREGDSPKDRER